MAVNTRALPNTDKREMITRIATIMAEATSTPVPVSVDSRLPFDGKNFSSDAELFAVLLAPFMLKQLSWSQEPSKSKSIRALVS